MFGPYCPVHRRRVLLSTDRIVRFESPGRGHPAGHHVVVLRCLCGTLVDWNQQQPSTAQTDDSGSHERADAEARQPMKTP